MKVGLIQLNSSQDVAQNMAQATRLICEAKDKGATYVLTPENTNLMTLSRDHLLAHCEREDEGLYRAQFSKLAEDLAIWLHIGSMATMVPTKISKSDAPTIVNRSYLFSPKGVLAATYDKIHMFDVTLPNGESYCESANYQAGKSATFVDTGEALIGLTICYDLRFPHLFRNLARAGSQMITVPAAFTQQTGEAHWQVLLRARAIETGCFILASAQCGIHDGGRQTFGHTMIISPWGDVLAQCDGTTPSAIVADLDLSLVVKARQAIPAINNQQMFDLKKLSYHDW